MIPSADQFRATVTPTILVDIPGTAFTFRVRVPDVPELIATGQVDQAMLDAALVSMKRMLAKGEHRFDRATKHFLDTWTVAACVEPRVIADDAPMIPGALRVGELTLLIKIRILTATTTRAKGRTH